MIYFLRNGNGQQVKIGFSETPFYRKNALQVGNPNPLVMIGMMEGDPEKEVQLHRKFSRLRWDGKGGSEWYQLTDGMKAFIESHCITDASVLNQWPVSEFKIVTPEIAASWLENYNYDRQRRLRKDHVSLLITEMQKGRFKPTSQIGLAIFDGRVVLVNGQHTLHAIAESGLPQLVNVVKHTVASEREIAELYYAYDIHKRRTFSEIAQVSNVAGRTGLSSSQISKMGAAIRFIARNFKYGTCHMPLIDQCEMTVEYGQAGLHYFHAVADPIQEVRKKLVRKATLSVGLVTFHYAVKKYGEDHVAAFWKQVAQDDGLRRSDPRKAAHHHLLVTQMPSGRGLISEKVCDHVYSARYLAACWNAWVEGGDLDQVVVSVHQPIRILGTPFGEDIGLWQGK